MYVLRDVEETFGKIAEVYSIVAVVGARQAGKTTLLKKKLEEVPKSGYVTLDDPDARDIFNEDIKKFEKQYVEGNAVTGIDEVQYGRDAGIKLKYLADRGHKIWVTSSSEILLSRDVLSYLVGRVSIIRLYPFSLREFLRAKNIRVLTDKIKSRAMWEHINYGGYPRVVLTDDTEIKQIILRDLIETMLLKDVSRSFSIEDLDALERLTKYLAANTGALLNYESVMKVLGISFQTLRKYLNAMEKSYIITRVSPFYTNKTKELTKRSKVYFTDTGLRNVLLRRSYTEPSGKIFENYVLMELKKAGLEVKYWRTKSGAEVDFVVEVDGNLIPVEVKTSSSSMSRSLASFIRTYSPEEAFVIFYRGERKEYEAENCRVVFTDVFELVERWS